MKSQEKSKEELNKLSKAKPKIRNSTGGIIPSVTTVIGAVSDQSGLVKWANKLGLDGVDAEDYKRHAADLGTCVHARCQAFLEGKEADLAGFLPNIVELSNIGYQSFRLWADRNLDEVVDTELQMQNEEFSGRCDMVCYARSKGQTFLTLVDIKTGNFVDKKVKAQLEAYAHLFEETRSVMIDRIASLQLNKDEVDYIYLEGERSPKAWEFFQAALKVQQLGAEKW